MIDGLRLGAYVLAADPTWVRSSISRYYDHLDVLVVSVPVDGRGWTGAPVASQTVLDQIREIDTRGIVRVVAGSWVRPDDPLAGDTDQRRDALAAVGSDVDWVLQLDTDEVLPDVRTLARVLRIAQDEGIGSVEWPMRVLYRRLRSGRYLQVAAADGGDYYEYPGPIAVRPGSSLRHCRKASGVFLRPAVHGDVSSLQVRRAPEAGEVRRSMLGPGDVILHNSWARPPASIRRKIASWGHNAGWRTTVYYWVRWLPAPLLWRAQRGLHPFDRDQWQRLTTASGTMNDVLLVEDR
jgi:hypothetical protein